MNTTFENNAYFASKFKNELDDNFRQTITLKYKHDEDVTIEKFQANYSPDGWFLRKIVAIPLAIGGVLKTIFHLFQAIIASTNLFSSDQSYSKSRLFYVRRDLQEVKGWVISLFDDMKGQFHIQESQFHKTCYDCALENEKKSKNGRSDQTIEDPKEDPKANSSDLVFEKIQTFQGTPQDKNSFIKNTANEYFDNKDYVTALQVIEKIQDDIDTKEKFIIKVVEQYIESNLYNPALELTKKIVKKTEEKNTLLSSIADGLILSKEYSKVQNVVNEVSGNEDARDHILLKLSHAYVFNEKNPEQALIEVLKVKNDELNLDNFKDKEHLLFSVVSEFIKQKKYGQAFEVTVNHTKRPDLKNSFLKVITRNYLNNTKELSNKTEIINTLDKAAEVIKQITFNSVYSQGAHALCLDLAKQYKNSEEYEKALNALDAIKKFRGNTQEIETLIFEEIETLIFEIADALKVQEKLDLAFTAISMITANIKGKALFLIELAKHHHHKESPLLVQRALKEIVKDECLDFIPTLVEVDPDQIHKLIDLKYLAKYLAETITIDLKALLEKKQNSEGILNNIKETTHQQIDSDYVWITVAEGYACNQQGLKKALAAISEMKGDLYNSRKEKLIELIAGKCLEVNNYALAFEAISNNRSDLTFDDFLISVAVDRLSSSQKIDYNKLKNVKIKIIDQAYDVLERITIENNKKILIEENATKIVDSLYIDLAKEYKNSEQYEKALEALKKIKLEKPKKEFYLLEIAKTFKKAGKMDLAFVAISMITANIKDKAHFIIELAKHHHENEEAPKVLGLLNELVKDISSDIIRKNNINSIEELREKCKIDIFFNDLATKSYENAKHLFDKKSESKDIFDNINLTLSEILPDKLKLIKNLNTKEEIN